MTDEITRRRNITFAQAEGAEPLPTQLALREINQALRVRIQKVITENMFLYRQTNRLGYPPQFRENG